MSEDIQTPKPKIPEGATLRKDFTEYSHNVETTNLTFELNAEDDVHVSSKLRLVPNPDAPEWDGSVVLNGAKEPELDDEGNVVFGVHLASIKLNGVELDESQYEREGENLRLLNVPSGALDIEVKTQINPQANEALSGLYMGGEQFITQCESEGFRNITFFPDRPSVLSTYTVEIIGDPARFPEMVSNGDVTERKELADGRVSLTYHDATPKPSYLFAEVAGNFDVLRDTYTIGAWRKEGDENSIPNSRAGEVVELEVYVDPGDLGKAHFAMDSLKKVMELDERIFNREYDLDTYRMVSTDYFTFGAMENKGLNIFNSSALLADPQVATDNSYQRVFDVIAHEYAHNWSGNRVTIKDWFEIALKEGLTNLRENMMSAACEYVDEEAKRIESVNKLRSWQFPMDAGPNARPIRPDFYEAVGNMYGGTTYAKGSEVIRMMEEFLGHEMFIEGLDYYFEKFDGTAARIDDLIDSFQTVSGMNFAQFKDTWFHQAGTPELTFTDAYDPVTQTYTLTVEQFKPKVNEHKFPKDEPYHLPIKLGLLDSQGNDIALELANDDGQTLLNDGQVLSLRDRKQTYVFKNVPEKPIPSLMRDFSAPVRTKYDYSRDDLVFLMQNDTNSFNRWEAGQKLMTDVLKEQVSAAQAGQDIAVDRQLLEAMRTVLGDDTIKAPTKSLLLALPNKTVFSGQYGKGELDVAAVDKAYDVVKQAIAENLQSELEQAYADNRYTMDAPYDYNGADAAARAIRHTALGYLLNHPQNDGYLALAQAEHDAQDNKTDILAGLAGLAHYGTPEQYEPAMQQFYDKWHDNSLQMATWFGMQASIDREDAIEKMQELLEDPAFDKKNPNLARGLLYGFMGNIPHYHNKDGSGYRFITKQIIALNKVNPAVAAGLAEKLGDFEKYDPQRRGLLLGCIQHIAKQEGISKAVIDKINNALSAYEESDLETTPVPYEVQQAVSAGGCWVERIANDNAPGQDKGQAAGR